MHKSPGDGQVVRPNRHTWCLDCSAEYPRVVLLPLACRGLVLGIRQMPPSRVWGHRKCPLWALGGLPFRLDVRWEGSAVIRHTQLRRIRCVQHHADLHRAEVLRGLDPCLHMRQPTSGHIRTFHRHSGLLLQVPQRGGMTSGIGSSEQHQGF